MKIKSIVKAVTKVFKRKVKQHSEKIDQKDLTPELANEFTGIVKQALCEAGVAALEKFIQSYDEKTETVTKDGKQYHWKMASEKQFLTPFGYMKLDRNLYQASDEGVCYVPIDKKWGMVGEFATSEVREAVLFSVAHVTTKETEELLARFGWFNATEKTIRNITKKVGDFLEQNNNELDDLIRIEEKIPDNTEVVVASVDGVNVLLDIPGNKRGPKEKTSQPESPQQEQTKTSYHNATVGAISFYSKAKAGEKSAERILSRYAARMPEDKAVKLKRKFEDELEVIESALSPKVEKVFLCDGHIAIWNYADNNPRYDDYKKLVDFYHTTEHLSKASEAIFGNNALLGKQWYNSWYDKLLTDDCAPDGILQSMELHAAKLKQTQFDALCNEITFFRRNKHRMLYAEFRRNGLPIGSGPVEAACKTIVKTRLCRSGMRWSVEGGQRLLSLRCYIKSHRWDDFWQSYCHLATAC